MSTSKVVASVAALALEACASVESPSAAWEQRTGALQTSDVVGELSWLQQTPRDPPEYPVAEKVVCPACSFPSPEKPSGRCFSSQECPSGKVCVESSVLPPYFDANSSCLQKNKLPRPKYCKDMQYGGAFGELVQEECAWSTACFHSGLCSLQKKGESGAPFDRCVASPSGCAASAACQGLLVPNPSGNGCDAVQITQKGWELSPPQCGKVVGANICVVLDANKGALTCVKL